MQLPKIPENYKAPDDIIKVADVEYKMTYNLLQALAMQLEVEQEMNGVKGPHLFMMSSTGRICILYQVLAPRNERGEITLPEEEQEDWSLFVNSNTGHLSISEVTEILEWATAHVTHFFYVVLNQSVQNIIDNQITPLEKLAQELKGQDEAESQSQ